MFETKLQEVTKKKNKNDSIEFGENKETIKNWSDKEEKTSNEILLFLFFFLISNNTIRINIGLTRGKHFLSIFIFVCFFA